MFFWNSLVFSTNYLMLSIWSLVPLPFLNPAWTSGSSRFTDCWSLAWRILSITLLDLPGGSDGKASAYNAGDPGSIPGLGRSPGEGNGNPLQYSCLENPKDTVHRAPKSWTRLHFHSSFSCIGEGNGSPLQCSCLENPRDRVPFWAAVSGVTQSWTRLKQLSSSNRSTC